MNKRIRLKTLAGIVLVLVISLWTDIAGAESDAIRKILLKRKILSKNLFLVFKNDLFKSHDDFGLNRTRENPTPTAHMTEKQINAICMERTNASRVCKVTG